MNAWKRFAGIGLLFATGFLAGATVSTSLELGAARADRGKFWQRGPSPLSSDFYSELHLEEKQRAALETILDRKREELDNFRGEMATRIDEIMTRARGEIELILDDAQTPLYRAKLAEWEKQLRRRQEKMREGFHRESAGAADHPK